MTDFGHLGFLGELDLPPCVEEDDDDEQWPSDPALEAAFGERLAVARAVHHDDGWEERGSGGAILVARADILGIEALEVWGGSGPMDSWISYDYYAPDRQGRSSVCTRTPRRSRTGCAPLGLRDMARRRRIGVG